MKIIIILFASMIVMLLLSVPVAYSIAISSIIALVTKDVNLMIAAQKMITGVDSTLFVAIPMFTFAGYLMEAGGLSRKLVDWAQTGFSWVPGATGSITIVSCMVFAALSGSAPATIAAIGAIMMPALLERGYKEDEAAALVVAGGGLGPIIPPSIVLVIYGATMGVSIADLFIGCTVPGIILGISYILLNIWRCKKNGIKEPRVHHSLKEFLLQTLRALPVLFLIIIILGGIYGGIFTPTEASAVAVVYAIILSICYRNLTVKKFIEACKKTAMASAGIMFIVGASAMFSYCISATKATKLIADAVIPYMVSKEMYLLVLMVLLFVVGAVMDIAPAILIFGPVMAPIGVAMGVDPLHLGCVFVMNLVIGMMTPPFGMDLFTGSTVLNVAYHKIVHRAVPYILVSMVMIIVFALVPQIVLFLPNLI